MIFLEEVIDAGNNGNNELVIGIVGALAGVLVSAILPFTIEMAKALFLWLKNKKRQKRYFAEKIYEWLIRQYMETQSLFKNANSQFAAKWNSLEKQLSLEDYFEKFQLSWFEVERLFNNFRYEDFLVATKELDLYNAYIIEKINFLEKMFKKRKGKKK